MNTSIISLKLELYEKQLEMIVINDEDSKEETFLEKEKGIHTTLYIDGKRISALKDDRDNTNEIVADFKAFILKSEINGKLYCQSKELQLTSGFVPLNCSCGQMGCAGINDGIHSFHKKNIVKWKIKDRLTRKIIGRKYISFDRAQYEKEIEKIRNFLKENENVVLSKNGSDYKVSAILQLKN